MRSHQTERAIETRAALDFVDITEEVQVVVDGAAIPAGQVTVLVRDPSCSLIVNERESGLLHDLRRALDSLDARDAGARRALLGSASIVLPVVDGRLRLGTWQRLMLVELDEPGRRSVLVHVVGD